MKKSIIALFLALALAVPQKALASYTYGGVTFASQQNFNCTATTSAPCSLAYTPAALHSGNGTDVAAVLVYTSYGSDCTQTINLGGTSSVPAQHMSAGVTDSWVGALASTSNVSYHFTTASTCTISATLYYN